MPDFFSHQIKLSRWRGPACQVAGKSPRRFRPDAGYRPVLLRGLSLHRESWTWHWVCLPQITILMWKTYKTWNFGASYFQTTPISKWNCQLRKCDFVSKLWPRALQLSSKWYSQGRPLGDFDRNNLGIFAELLYHPVTAGGQGSNIQLDDLISLGLLPRDAWRLRRNC